MVLSDHVTASETVHASTTAYRGEFGDSSGTLACTDSGLVYVGKRSTIDVSRRMICPIEFERQSVDAGSLLLGFGSIVGGALAFAAGTVVEDLQPLVEVLGPLAVVFGLVVLGAAVYYRRASLEVHLPSTSYTFTSKQASLADVATAVRQFSAP